MGFEYKAIETADGSPTLSLGPTWEAMHALDGAFTETQYIYQPTVEKAYAAVENPVFLSMGLGLGYNEILIACEAIKYSREPKFIQSYESVPELRIYFNAWVFEKESPLNEIYEKILQLYVVKYGFLTAEVKTLLRDLISEKGLDLGEGFDENTVPPASNGILFDAFSSKTSPQLWTQDFLTKFFAEAADRPCFVSTYACMGNLKRALAANHFSVEYIKGFGKKRESTFAQLIER